MANRTSRPKDVFFVVPDHEEIRPSKKAGNCGACGEYLSARQEGTRMLRKKGRDWQPYHVACATFVPSRLSRAFRRCEDAPCCGHGGGLWLRARHGS